MLFRGARIDSCVSRGVEWARTGVYGPSRLCRPLWKEEAPDTCLGFWGPRSSFQGWPHLWAAPNLMGARQVHVVAQGERGCGRGFPESSSTLTVEGILGSSVQFRCSVVSYSLWPHGLQQARLPCPSPTPGTCSNSCPSSRWCLGRAHIKLWHWVQIPELSLRDLDERHKLADSHPSTVSRSTGPVTSVVTNAYFSESFWFKQDLFKEAVYS